MIYRSSSSYYLNQKSGISKRPLLSSVITKRSKPIKSHRRKEKKRISNKKWVYHAGGSKIKQLFSYFSSIFHEKLRFYENSKYWPKYSETSIMETTRIVNFL